MTVSEIIKELNEDAFRFLEKGAFPNLKNIDQSVMQSRWMGYLPATQEAIGKKEVQLKIGLPQSYKEFLLISNGFRRIWPGIYNLYPIENINWARIIENKNLLEEIESDPQEMSDTDYLIYGSKQRPQFYRAEYFLESLKISDWGDACCLYLNPAIIHNDEWEVLFYARWLPGTERFRSFKEFLLGILKSNRSLPDY